MLGILPDLVQNLMVPWEYLIFTSLIKTKIKEKEKDLYKLHDMKYSNGKPMQNIWFFFPHISPVPYTLILL